MKVCKKCGRSLEGKRWVLTRPGEVERAKMMERLETTVCEDCTRHPEAHSAILQVKGMPKKELEALLVDELAKSNTKGSLQRVFEKGGSYRFTSKSMARSVGRKLRDKGAQIKETSKIVTLDKQTSRQTTRITVRAVFNIFPGDIVEYSGNKYLVDRLYGGFLFTKGGKKIRSKDVKKKESTREKGFYISSNPPLVFIESSKETIEVDEPGEGAVEIIRSDGKMWVRKI